MCMNAPFSFSSSANLFQLFKSLTSLTSSGSLFNPAEKKIINFSYLDDIVAHQKKKLRQSYRGFCTRSWLIKDEVS